jgi:hypothetical protein
MAGTNPFATPATSIDASTETIARRHLVRSRVGVVIVTVVVSVAAVGYAVRGVLRLLEATRSPNSEIAENPLVRSFVEAQLAERNRLFWHATTSLVTAAVLAVFAYMLVRYSRQLQRAAISQNNTQKLLEAQTACWLVAAFLALAALVRAALS